MEFWRFRRQPSEQTIELAGPPDHREAFAEGVRRGRTEEKARRHGHPFIALVVALIAVAGVAILALAVKEGSFSRGGQIVDQQLSTVADKAQTAGQTAAVQTGQALKNAGDTIEQKASNASGKTP